MKDVVAAYRVLSLAEFNEKNFSVLLGITSDLGCEVLEGRNLALYIEEALCDRTHFPVETRDYECTYQYYLSEAGLIL